MSADNEGMLREVRKMTVCPKCFAEIPDTSVFCLECGARIREDTTDSLYAEGSDREVYPEIARANLLRMKGEYEQAIEICLSILRRFPSNETAHALLGDIYADQGKLDDAEQHVAQARQLAPGSLEVIYNEALIYESQGRFEDAIRVLTGAASSLRGRGTLSESRRRSLGIVYNQLGRLYREVQNYSAAIAVYEEMRALGPEEASQARSMLIESYRAGGQLDRAIAESERVLADEPDRKSVV